MQWLKGEPGYEESIVYKSMMKRNLSSPAFSLKPNSSPDSKDDETFELTSMVSERKEKAAKSYALRLLIHYLGDIHQPLHCSSRVDKNFPSGDKGGNLFPLPNHYTTDDLHAVWDSVIYNYHDSVKTVRYYWLYLFHFSPLTMTPGKRSTMLRRSFWPDIAM